DVAGDAEAGETVAGARAISGEVTLPAAIYKVRLGLQHDFMGGQLLGQDRNPIRLSGPFGGQGAILEGAADDAIPEAEREEHFEGGGLDRHDALGRRGYRDGHSAIVEGE